MTFGYSRDDAGSFLPDYVKKEILERDPFQSLDIGGVGKLVDMAVQARPRQTRTDLKCGICGEHGGDPKSRRVLPPGRPELRELLAPSASPSPASPRPMRRSRSRRQGRRQEGKK